MRHVDDIRVLITTLLKSCKFHALVVESPPGWGKSSTVERALKEASIQYKSLGSYSTPLALYNALSESPSSTFVLDDCAGLFSDPVAMAILKAATWSSTGGEGRRIITWNTTSERALAASFELTGKLILITNSIPKGAETRAFLSRTFYLSIKLSAEEITDLLMAAARNLLYFEDQPTATRVAAHLAARAGAYSGNSINLRTLQLGYELAKASPERWPELLNKLTPEPTPTALIASLSKSGASVEEQFKEFTKTTGLSRRTFFKYRESALCTDASPSRS